MGSYLDKARETMREQEVTRGHYEIDERYEISPSRAEPSATELARLRTEEERVEDTLVDIFTAAGGIPNPRDEYDRRLAEVDELLGRIEELESQLGRTEDRV